MRPLCIGLYGQFFCRVVIETVVSVQRELINLRQLCWDKGASEDQIATCKPVRRSECMHAILKSRISLQIDRDLLYRPIVFSSILKAETRMIFFHDDTR